MGTGDLLKTALNTKEVLYYLGTRNTFWAGLGSTRNTFWAGLGRNRTEGKLHTKQDLISKKEYQKNQFPSPLLKDVTEKNQDARSLKSI